MGSWKSGALVVVAVVSTVAVGVVVADEASIKSVATVDTIDRDGDGAVAGFNLEITADTNCVGCNDESDDDPNIDPRFYVYLVDEDGDEVELDRSELVDNEDDLEYVYEVSNDLIEQYKAQTLDVRVVLFDEDTMVGEAIDETTIEVDIERPGDDRTPTPTDTLTPTDTPTPTETPTPTDSPTPTDTPTSTDSPTPTDSPAPTDAPTEADDGGEFESGGGGDVPESTEVEQESSDEGIQDTDGDGVIDSQDYAPDDPDVQEKSDLNSVPVPGFGFLEVSVGFIVLALLTAVYRRRG